MFLYPLWCSFSTLASFLFLTFCVQSIRQSRCLCILSMYWIQPLSPMAAVISITQATVITCLDSCSSLLIGFSASLLVLLQLVLQIVKYSFKTEVRLCNCYLKFSNCFLYTWELDSANVFAWSGSLLFISSVPLAHFAVLQPYRPFRPCKTCFPQGLCTCCFLFLESSSSRSSQGLLLHFPQVFIHISLH